MTPEEEKRVLRMLESWEFSKRFWMRLGIWFKWLTAVAMAVPALKYLGDLLKGGIK